MQGPARRRACGGEGGSCEGSGREDPASIFKLGPDQPDQPDQAQFVAVKSRKSGGNSLGGVAP